MLRPARTGPAGYCLSEASERAPRMPGDVERHNLQLRFVNCDTRLNLALDPGLDWQALATNNDLRED